MTIDLNQTDQLLTNYQTGEMFYLENHSYPKNQSRRWKYAKPDLEKQCLICDTQIKVKYILPRQQYSQKNNWGYWTKKPTDQHKYMCDNCLIKLYDGNINDWINNQTRADVFYNYVKRGQFKKNE